jgi:hypothetical protein
MPSKVIITTTGQKIRKGECELCGDTGIVPVPKRPAQVRLDELWKWQAPCGCRAGDQWREEARLCLDPPPCREGCGRTAEVTLTTRPRCLPCDIESRMAL